MRVSSTFVALLCGAFSNLFTFDGQAQVGTYGTIPGAFRVNQTGEAVYSMPIATPTGRGGVRPNLSLEYRHRGGDGPLGIGWGIGGLSQITRCPKTVAQDGQAREVRYDTEDQFCLDGMRLKVVPGGASEYGTEIADFRKVVAVGQAGNGPAKFVVTNRDGTKYYYGTDYDSSLVTQGTNRNWALNYIIDPFSNVIQFFYQKDDNTGEFLPSYVTYTRNDAIDPYGDPGNYAVFFDYENKPLAHQRSGYPFFNQKRVHQIRVSRYQNGWQPIYTYHLNYVPEAASPHYSLLEYVQQCGPTECLNGSRFEWVNGQIASSGFGSATSTASQANLMEGYIGDFNGDGFEDVVSRYHPGTSQWSDYGAVINYGNGQGLNAGDVQLWGYCIDYRVIEFDGDGRADLLCIDPWGQSNTAALRIHRFTGSGWTPVALSATAQWDTGLGGYKLHAADINGDGLTDLIYSGSDTGGVWSVRLNTGGAFAAPQNAGSDVNSALTQMTLGIWVNRDDDAALELVVPYTAYGGSIAHAQYDPAFSALVLSVVDMPGLQLAAIPRQAAGLPDINGDGRADLVYRKVGQSVLYTRLSNGVVYGAEQQTVIPQDALNTARFADVNGDGRSDMLRLVSGESWEIHYSTNGTTFGAGSGTAFSGVFSQLQIADVTGDGFRDVTYRHSPDDAWYVHPHLAKTKTITTFFDGRGNFQNVTYLPLTKLDYFYNYTTPSLPNTRQYRGPLYVVDRYEANSGIGVTGYSYANGIVGATSLVRYGYWDAMVDNRGRGFLGFNYFRTIDYGKSFYEDRELLHDYPATGWPTYSIRRQIPGAQYMLESDPSPPVVTPLSGGRSFVHIDDEVSREYEVTPAYAEQLIRTMTRHRDFDAMSGAIDLDRTDTAASGLTYRTEIDITLQSLGDCRGLPDAVSVKRSGYNMVERTRSIDNVFDSRCRLTSSTNTSESDPAKRLKKSLYYDGYGNVKTITLDNASNNAGARVTEFFYDTPGHPGHLPSSVKRYVNGEYPQTESFTHDYDLILPATHTAVGGATTTFTFDDFGQLTRIDRPDTSFSTFWRTMDYVGYAPDSISAEAAYTSDGDVTYQFVDTFGRPLLSQTRLVANWTRVSAKRSTFDARGNLTSETQPFIWGESEYLIDYDHDLLDRTIYENRPISEQQASGGITTIVHNGLTTTVTTPGNPGNQTSVYVADAIGRITQMTDSMNGVTEYAYNAFDQLTRVEDPADHVTLIGYNDRGDKTSVTDPDYRGVWSYEHYTVFGELVTQRDPKNQVVTFGYDQLGRLRTRSEPDFAGQNTTFTFRNTTDYQHGLPWEEISPEGFKREFTFDPMRRLAQEKVTIDAAPPYATDFAYYGSGASAGKLQRITYPTSTGGVRVQAEYEYDDVGLLMRVLDPSPGGVVYRIDGRDALAREMGGYLGSGLVEGRWYDRANLQLDRIQTFYGTVQNVEYEYYPSGNLASRTNNINGKVETFTYDNLSRILTQNVNGGQALGVNYLGDGNIQSKSDVGTYGYGGASGGAHAVTSITGLQTNSYVYDNNGNMTNRDGDSITWWSHNLPKKVNYGVSNSAEFWYGTDRSRYKQVAVSSGSTVTTRYIGRHFEIEQRGSLTIYRHYIFAEGQPVAQFERRSDSTNLAMYLHRDYQGGIVATTGSTGTLRQRWEYEPFGRRWLTAGSAPDDTERGYSDHEHLDSVSLIHMNGRVQDPELGRFTSADPSVQAPYYSQSLNRYSYGWNNPTTLIDPTGFQSDLPGPGCAGCGTYFTRANPPADSGSWWLTPEHADALINWPPRPPDSGPSAYLAPVTATVGRLLDERQSLVERNEDLLDRLLAGGGDDSFAQEIGQSLRSIQGEIDELDLLIYCNIGDPCGVIPKYEELYFLGGWGLLRGLVGRGATAAEILAANRVAGLAAERRAATQLVAEGNTILGSQVSVRTSFGLRRIDHLVQTPSGQVLAIEVKSGNAARNAAQLAKDSALATEGGVLVGTNAPAALRGQQLIIQTIERRF